MNEASAVNDTVLQCQNLVKTFRQGEQQVKVLQGVDFAVQRSERVAIVGSSGAGKSTLLHILGGLDNASSGTITVAGQDLSQTSAAARGRLRNRALGFIYQFHHLLAEFTALENVAMPLLIRGMKPDEASREASDILARVGLGERLNHKPGQLSGGERQRTAVARALITHPVCVLADEPTGNLDRQNAEQVFELMLALNQALQTSLVIVTHDPALAERMDSIWQLRDGVLYKLQQAD